MTMYQKDLTYKEIVKLPDYPALEKLASALWQQENNYHGAAIMVGAGFSRSAASTGDVSRQLPLWNDLSAMLAAKLSTTSSDPLRLAEEYSAYFGKPALHDLVKNAINDVAWVPGKLHVSLLNLPWKEVLTTNWDTLLERASEEVDQIAYSIVAKQEDLSSARTPRIVKLHGTVNVTEALIFTQEEYRRYPECYAAFVNFTRQVFIENELCLVGFSGEDPNFLQWAGWVRDHLAIHARRIYLVGAFNLTAPKRKYLESINISPIDLYKLVSDYDDPYVRANDIFVQTLHDLKPCQPWEWQPTSLQQSCLSNEELNASHDIYYAAKRLEQQLPILIADRESYPGWLVCPAGLRRQLQNQISDPFPMSKYLSAMGPDNKIRLLYEISWRYETSYTPLPEWLSKHLIEVCDPDTPCCLTKKQQLEIALLLLKNVRWLGEDKAEDVIIDLLERNLKHWPESHNEIIYYRAIKARDQFNYPALESLITQMTVPTPIWKLRKASLLAELGQLDAGVSLIDEAYQEFAKQYRKDRKSIYILSRLTWADWLRQGVMSPKEFSYDKRKLKCDPWDYIDNLKNLIIKRLEGQQNKRSIEPSFSPGHYRDNSKNISINNELPPFFLLDGMVNSFGAPLRWENIGLFAWHAEKLTELDEIDRDICFSLAIRSAHSNKSEGLKRVFSRHQVANFSDKETENLIQYCRIAIDYWVIQCQNQDSQSRHHALGRCQVFIEVLARVSIRAMPDQARDIFVYACKLGDKKELWHNWLSDSLANLLEHSRNSIPKFMHKDILMNALQFPLPYEVGFKKHLPWPNPIIEYPGVRSDDSKIDHRLDEIIGSIAPCSQQSTPALLRLIPLINEGFLTKQGRVKLAENIWGTMLHDQHLPDTGLLCSTLLILPSPDPARAKAKVRRYLFEAKDELLYNPYLLMDITKAAKDNNISEFPSNEQALVYFDKLTAWRPNVDEQDIFGYSRHTEQEIAEFIGKALSYSIVPALSTSALNEENFQKLYTFYTETHATEAIIALPYFAANADQFVQYVETSIKKALRGRGELDIAYAAHAILQWRIMQESANTNELISRLVYQVTAGQTNGMVTLLWVMCQLKKHGALSDSHINSLSDMLPMLFDNLHYAKHSNLSQESIGASLIRAGCIELAREIINNGTSEYNGLISMMEEAKTDALPEVRFA